MGAPSHPVPPPDAVVDAADRPSQQPVVCAEEASEHAMPLSPIGPPATLGPEPLEHAGVEAHVQTPPEAHGSRPASQRKRGGKGIHGGLHQCCGCNHSRSVRAAATSTRAEGSTEATATRAAGKTQAAATSATGTQLSEVRHGDGHEEEPRQTRRLLGLPAVSGVRGDAEAMDHRHRGAASRRHEAAATLITALLLGEAAQLDGERSSALTHARWHPWRRHHGGTGCRRQ